MRTFADLIVRRPRLILMGLGVLTLLAGAAATGLKFEFSPQSVYEGQDTLVAFSEEHKQYFTHEDAVVLVVIEASGSHDVLAGNALEWQRGLASDLTEVPRVLRVDGLVRVRLPRLGGSSLLVPDGPLNEDAAARVRERVDRQPLVEGILISGDRRLATLLVEFDPAARSMDQTRQVVTAIREVLGQHPPPEGYRTALSGIAALRVDVVENLQADQRMMFPLSGGLFLVVLVLMFRSWRITVLSLAAVFCGVVWAFGILAVLGQSFNLLSNVVPTLTLIIGAANVVHLISRYLDELPRHDGDPASAARETMREMSVTCLLTFATTAIGFGSLLVSGSVILRQFAIQASLALVCEYFSVVMILGAGLAWTMRSRSRAVGSGRVAAGVVDGLSRIVAVSPRRVVLVSLGIVAACAVMARSLAVNSYLYETYDDAHRSMQTIRLLDEKLSGLAPIEIQLRARTEGALFDADVFNRIEALQSRLRKFEPVRFVRSYTDLHRTTLRESGPANAEAVGRMRRNILRVRDLTRRDYFITDDDRVARVLIRISDVGSAAMNRLIDAIERDLAATFPRGSGVEARVTGDAYLHARCMDRFVRDLFYSLLTASIAILAVISVLFRSVRTGLISVLPNLTPLAVTLGYLGVRDYPLTAGTVIVFAITLGIAVDDTIHFLSRFHEERRRGGKVAESIHAVFRSSGRAIILTTVLIISGMSVLLLSNFVPTRRFAELTAITMAAALLGDLLLLPACLLLFERKRRDDERD